LGEVIDVRFGDCGLPPPDDVMTLGASFGLLNPYYSEIPPHVFMHPRLKRAFAGGEKNAESWSSFGQAQGNDRLQEVLLQDTLDRPDALNSTRRYMRYLLKLVKEIDIAHHTKVAEIVSLTTSATAFVLGVTTADLQSQIKVNRIAATRNLIQFSTIGLVLYNQGDEYGELDEY
jgi:hypothetical protein